MAMLLETGRGRGCPPQRATFLWCTGVTAIWQNGEKGERDVCVCLQTSSPAIFLVRQWRHYYSPHWHTHLLENTCQPISSDVQAMQGFFLLPATSVSE